VWQRERFDYLVNNAGVGIYASFEETTEAQFDSLMNIHLKGTFFLTQKLLPLIADGGRIVNVSTGLTRFALPGYSAYATMKGGVEVLTRYMAKELGLRQIGICTVCSRGLGSYRLVVHHMDYAHECDWDGSIILTVGKRKRSIPDCLTCRLDSDLRFQMCRRRLQLLHRRCHVDFHKGKRNLRPVN